MRALPGHAMKFWLVCTFGRTPSHIFEHSFVLINDSQGNVASHSGSSC